MKSIENKSLKKKNLNFLSYTNLDRHRHPSKQRRQTRMNETLAERRVQECMENGQKKRGRLLKIYPTQLLIEAPPLFRTGIFGRKCGFKRRSVATGKDPPCTRLFPDGICERGGERSICASRSNCSTGNWTEGFGRTRIFDGRSARPSYWTRSCNSDRGISGRALSRSRMAKRCCRLPRSSSVLVACRPVVVGERSATASRHRWTSNNSPLEQKQEHDVPVSVVATQPANTCATQRKRN